MAGGLVTNNELKCRKKLPMKKHFRRKNDDWGGLAPHHYRDAPLHSALLIINYYLVLKLKNAERCKSVEILTELISKKA